MIQQKIYFEEKKKSRQENLSIATCMELHRFQRPVYMLVNWKPKSNVQVFNIAREQLFILMDFSLLQQLPWNWAGRQQSIITALKLSFYDWNSDL